MSVLVTPSSLQEYAPHSVYVTGRMPYVVGIDSTTWTETHRLVLPPELFPIGCRRICPIPGTRMISVGSDFHSSRASQHWMYARNPGLFGADPDLKKTHVAVFDPDDSELPRFLNTCHLGTVRGLAGVPSTSAFGAARLVSGDEAGQIVVCNAETGKGVTKVEGIQERKGAIHRLLWWHPAEVCIGSDCAYVPCYDLVAEEVVRTYAPPSRWNGPVQALAGDPEGRNLFVMSARGSTFFFTRNDAQYVMKKDTTPVSSICLALDRFLMVCGSTDRLVGVWDLRRLGRVVTLFRTVLFENSKVHSHEGNVREVDRVEDTLFASVCGNTVSLWDALSGKILSARGEKIVATRDPTSLDGVSYTSACVVRDEQDSELKRSLEDRLRFVLATYQNAEIRLSLRYLKCWLCVVAALW